MSDVLELGRKRARELGLRYDFDAGRFGQIYNPDDIHKLLGEGEEYFWTPLGDAGMSQKPEHTHRALGIGIRPIKQEQKIITPDEADKMSVKILGLTIVQVEELKKYYEMNTGDSAINIGLKKESPERALLRELIDGVKEGGILEYRGVKAPKFSLNSFVEKAKALLKESE